MNLEQHLKHVLLVRAMIRGEYRRAGGVGSGVKGHTTTRSGPLHLPGQPPDWQPGVPSKTPYDVIDNYVAGGSSDINGLLRNPSHENRQIASRPTDYDYKNEIKTLDTIAKKNPFKSATNLFRVVESDVVSDMRLGGIFQDKGFISTSAKQSSLNQISKDTGAFGNPLTVIHITVPAGMGHIDVNKELGKDHFYAHQHEMILPRGTKFRVISKSSNAMYVKALL